MAEPPVVAFLPEVGAWGPTNNCIAIAEVLRDRGLRCAFVVDESFAGVLAEKGFAERLIRVAESPADVDAASDVWADYIRETAPEFRKPTVEQVATVIRPIWETLIAQGRHAHDQLAETWRELAPAAIVTDNVSAFPSVLTSGVPWARAVSANPLELRDPAIPPVFSGYSANDRDGWDAFTATYRAAVAAAHAELDELCRAKGAPGLAPGEFQHVSPYLNWYLYPAEADYARSVALGDAWHRVDSSVRTPDRPFDVAAVLPGDGKLIYLSLGSLGSMDVPLMQRLIDSLARTPHRVIVSLGGLHEQLRLGERMYGEEYLPQTAFIGQCDLVITHGGNNTFCEAWHFGVPMIALPLFWDQYDNAQRVADLGVGRRLPTYAWEEVELLAAIEDVIADQGLRRRMQGAARRIQAARGRERAAELVERLARTGKAPR